MKKIKIAVIGIGNCASSLIQGIHYYKDQTKEDAIGLMHWDIGGYKPYDLDVVAAFDIDARKVGLDVAEAVFAPPNCTAVFQKEIPPTGTIVKMGCLLDGFSDHMKSYPEKNTFVLSEEPETTKYDVVRELQESGTEIMLNYLPVGSEKATEFYAECALEAGIGFVNNIPVFVASKPEFAERFQEKNLPLIGDDIKAQLGATITHRILTDLFKKRGVKLDRTYQLNTGGNTDFLNMLNHERLIYKRRSKMESIQAVAGERLDTEDIHVGPCDYIAWQKDRKVAFIRLEGRTFGNIPVNVEVRLDVEDSPNSAGVAIDAVRCAKLALERGQGGVIDAPSSFFYKHPPRQFSDDVAFQMMEDFISKK